MNFSSFIASHFLFNSKVTAGYRVGTSDPSSDPAGTSGFIQG
jgi:hypothetical protein